MGIGSGLVPDLSALEGRGGQYGGAMTDVTQEAERILREWRNNWPDVKGSCGQEFLRIRITDALRATAQATERRVWEEVAQALEASCLRNPALSSTGICQCLPHLFADQFRRHTQGRTDG